MSGVCFYVDELTVTFGNPYDAKIECRHVCFSVPINEFTVTFVSRIDFATGINPRMFAFTLNPTSQLR